jgi:hypothetical protein
MKPADVKAIKRVEIYDNHLHRNLRVVVRHRITVVRGGEPGTYKNVLVDVSGNDSKWPVTSLLFLDSYGDDMPQRIKERLSISGLGVCLAPGDRKSRGWTCFLYEQCGGALRLYPVGELATDDDLREPPSTSADEFLEALNHKRPFHFEISHYAVEEFLEGESGWRTLRENLRIVVRAGRQYVARPEGR